MKDLILKFLFKADSSGVRKEIKRIENDGKKASDKIGNGLKRAFAGLGTAIAGIGIGRIFKSAVDDAAKLEQSLLKLRAAAQNTGQDFDTIEKGLQRLRSEGTLSFQTITEASQQLLQQGFQADDIEPFLRALRNIGALENTVGNTNDAMRSFIRAISTNSIELVDNLSPALRKVVLELGGFNEIAKNADKQQQFLNITLDRGAQFADAYSQSIETVAGKQAQLEVETEKLSEAFGASLAPAFETSLEILTPLVQGLTEFLQGLSGSQKSLVAAGAVAGAAAIGFTGLAVAIGASATAMTVLTGGLVVVGAALATFAASQSALNSEVNEAADTVRDLETKLRRISRIKGNEREREILTKQLTDAQKDLNDALDNRIAKEERLIGLSATERKVRMAELKSQRESAIREAQKVAGKGRGGGRAIRQLEVSLLRTGDVAALKELRKDFFGRKATAAEELAQPTGVDPRRGNILSKQLGIIEKIERQQAILRKEQERYNEALKGGVGGTNGAANASKELKKELDKLKDKKKETKKEIITYEDRLNSLAGSLDTAAYNVDSITGAVEVLGDESARANDKVRGLGEGLRGFGGILSQLGFGGAGAGLGVVGAGLGLIGAAGGLFESLFDSSENQESILNQQLDLQREQFSFAKEQAGIEKKFFEDELEIIRLRAKREGTDPNKALADAITERLRDLGFTEEVSIENLELQRQRVKNESEEILRNKRLLSRAQNLSGGSGGVGQLVANLNNLRSEAGLPPMSGNIGDIINDTIVQLTARTQAGTAQDIQDLLEQGLRLDPAGAPRLGAASTSLQQVQPRGFSFLDVSRGGLQTAFGFAPGRAVEMVSGAGVPGQIGSLTVATEAMKTTEEKMLDTLDGQLSELKKQTDILSKLTGQDVTIAVLNAISAGQARSL